MQELYLTRDAEDRAHLMKVWRMVTPSDYQSDRIVELAIIAYGKPVTP